MVEASPSAAATLPEALGRQPGHGKPRMRVPRSSNRFDPDGRDERTPSFVVVPAACGRRRPDSPDPPSRRCDPSVRRSGSGPRGRPVAMPSARAAAGLADRGGRPSTTRSRGACRRSEGRRRWTRRPDASGRFPAWLPAARRAARGLKRTRETSSVSLAVGAPSPAAEWGGRGEAASPAVADHLPPPSEWT